MTAHGGQATGLRTSAFPIEHLMAEMLAAPFAGTTAFADAMIALDPCLEKRPFGNTSPTIALWRETERTLLAHFPGMSVDELVLRRDCLWFDGPDRHPGRSPEVPLAGLLARAAAELITGGPGEARLNPSRAQDEVAQRRLWRWYSFSLPPDMLLAAAGSCCERLPMVSPALEARLADRGFAEPHLHLKAAMTFPSLWSSAMRVLADLSVEPDFLQSPGADWDEGRDLGPLLLAGAVTRLVLAEFLKQTAFHPAGLRDFVHGSVNGQLVAHYGSSAIAALWQAVSALAAGQRPDVSLFKPLQHLYDRWIGRGHAGPAGGDVDPMGWWFGSSAQAHPDFGYTVAAFGYLGAAGQTDPLFAQLFWQTVRCRVLFYRHVVQRPMVPGLQWFTRTYARLGPPRKPLKNETFVQMAATLAGPGLRSLEVRLVPEGSVQKMRDVVCDIDQAARGLRGPASPGPAPAGGPEVGIVFHLSRSRGTDAEAGRPAAWSKGGHDDPAKNITGYRFADYYKKQRVLATALADLLDAYPRMLERVRGIDLCTDELAIPLWVLTPLVQHVQAAGHRARAVLLARDGNSPPPLGLTVHAGEDYVHLLGGLRRIDEAVDQLELGDGARIGHAVALGVSVREWALRSRKLLVPAGERLLDLLWARRVGLRAPNAFYSWLGWIDQELVRLGRDVFGRPLSADQLQTWWDALHDAGLRKIVGFPDGPYAPVPLDEQEALRRELVYRWLTDRMVHDRAQQLKKIEIEPEVPLVTALQEHVRGEIASRGIVVEINPSSNLLIGHLGDLTSHPLWRLCPPAGMATTAPPVRVCIGSDDPITFATTLPEEYQLLADALAGAGVDGPNVDAWLEAARQCGLASRFTVPASGKDLMGVIGTKTYPPP